MYIKNEKGNFFSWAYMKDIQAKGEAFCLKKRTSKALKFFNFFQFLWVIADEI